MLLVILLTFTVFVGELEGLDQAQRFVYGAAHGQIVDGDLPQDALVVDHKQPSGRQTDRQTPRLRESPTERRLHTRLPPSPVCDSVVFLQHAVIFGDLLGEVGHEGDLHRAQTALFSRRVNPVEVQLLKHLMVQVQERQNVGNHCPTLYHRSRRRNVTWIYK